MFKHKEKVKKNRHVQEFFRVIAIIIGAFIAAVGLEFFLVPNDFLDGGIVGIAIIITHFVKLPLGLFIGVLNLPFIIMAFFMLGKRAAIKTAIGVSSLTIATLLMHNKPALTDEFALALGYGGLLVGVGVGLALRYGGALDGSEALSVVLSQRTKYNIEQIILFLNLIIFGVAAFTISPESAMASLLLFYLVVAPLIKKTMDAGSEYRTAQIITTNPEPIIDAVHERLNRRIMSSDSQKSEKECGQVVNKFNDVTVLTVIVSRLEESEILEIAEENDKNVIVIFNNEQSIHGPAFRNAHH